MDHFGELDDPNARLPRDSEILKKAVEFMKPIAELFAKNKIQKDELSSVRDNLLKKMLGPNAPCARRRVSKKPSAADKDSKLDEKSSEKKDEGKDSSASSSGLNTTKKRPASANVKKRINFAKKSISQPEIKKETETKVKKETKKEAKPRIKKEANEKIEEQPADTEAEAAMTMEMLVEKPPAKDSLDRIMNP